MPVYEAASRRDNIEKSIHAFVEANVRSGLGLTVYYDGQEQLATLPSQWVEVDVLPGVAVAESRTAGIDRHSIWTECLLNMNCYQKKDGANLYALTVMSTNVEELFALTVGIPVRDYTAGGNPIVGGLQAFENPRVNIIPVDPSMGLSQINVTVPLRYHSVSID